MKPPLRRARTQAGATLIEVLVSILIFSLGILGMVAMQAKAVGYAVGAEDRSRAAILVNELVAAMWLEGTNNPSITTAWQTRVQDASQSGLPGAASSISSTTDSTTGVVTTKVSITWHAPSSPSSEADSSYVSQVVIP